MNPQILMVVCDLKKMMINISQTDLIMKVKTGLSYDVSNTVIFITIGTLHKGIAYKEVKYTIIKQDYKICS